jgi:hypothetical protein
VNTTARIPPVARAAATSATIMTSVVLINTTGPPPDMWSPVNSAGDSVIEPSTIPSWGIEG